MIITTLERLPLLLNNSAWKMSQFNPSMCFCFYFSASKLLFCPSRNPFLRQFCLHGLLITKVLTYCDCNGCATVLTHLISLAGPDWP